MLRDKGQIARLIRELEERGLLVRTPDERDRRVWCLTVTPEGEEKCDWFSALEARVAQDLLGALSKSDSVLLDEVLQSVQAQLDRLNTNA
jgi:DNA-binding MarR family transcriptional regulator